MHFFRRFLTKSVAFPLVHFFRADFPPFCPLLLWSGAQKTGMQHFGGKCNAFAAPFLAPRRTADRPSLSHRNDELASPAIAVQNLQSPDISDAIVVPIFLIPARPRKPACTKKCIPNWGRTSVYLLQQHDHGRPAIQSPAEESAAPPLHPSPISLRLCSHPKSGMPHHPTGEIARSQECMV